MKKLAYSGDTKIIKNIVNAINYLLDNSGGSEVEVTQILSSGTKIAEISVDGDSTDLYAPEGGGSEVSVTQILSSGTKIAEIEVDGVTTDLYAPQGGGGGNSITYGNSTPQTSGNNGDVYYLLNANNKKVGLFLYMVNQWQLIEGEAFTLGLTLLDKQAQRNYASGALNYSVTENARLICVNLNVNGEASTKALTSLIAGGTLVDSATTSDSWSNPNRNHASNVSLIDAESGDTITVSNASSGSYITQLHAIFKAIGTDNIQAIVTYEYSIKSDGNMGTSKSFNLPNGLYLILCFESSGTGATNQSVGLTYDNESGVSVYDTGLFACKAMLAEIDVAKTVEMTWANTTNYVSRGYFIYRLGVYKYLPASTGNKLCEAYAENFDATQLAWGSGTNPITFTALGATISNGVVSIPTKTSSSSVIGYVDLEHTARPFTAYIVAKLPNSASAGYDRVLSAMASRSANQGMIAYASYGTVLIGSWANDTSTGVSMLGWAVLAIQFASVGNALGKINNANAITKSPQTCGRYLTIGRTDIDPNTYNAEPADVDVKYFGVVDEAESLATIEANITSLMAEFGIS